MHSLRSLIDPGGCSLGFHTDRLRRTLDDLAERLRHTVSQAVAEAVAGVVQTAIRTALTGPRAEDDLDHAPTRHYPRHRPFWEESEELGEEDRLGGYRDSEPFEQPRTQTRSAHGNSSATWPAAVARGLMMAAWWLQRHRGRLPLLAALGVGGTATLVALSRGPVTVAGIDLATSLLGLASLQSMLSSTSSALDGFSSP
jgi:hypothetical protein